MKLNLINIIILVSSFQILFVALIVTRKYGKTLANRTLALLLFVMAIVLFNMFLWDIHYFDVNPRLMLSLIGIPLLIGPLIYLYAKFLSRPQETFKGIELAHFLPAFLCLAVVVPYLFQPEEQLAGNMSGNGDASAPFYLQLFNWLIMIQIIIYTLFTVRTVKRFSDKIKNYFSNIEKIKLDWLRNITILFSATLLLYTTENILVTWEVIKNDFIVSTLALAAFTYIFGYLVLIKSDIFINPGFTEQIIGDEENQPLKEEPKKYERSGLNEDKADYYLNLLLELMEKEKPYLDNELTLNKLAGLLSVSPHHLSEIINRKLNQNFFDFINKYRVERVKQDLVDAQKQNLTLLAVALDAGFSSKSSFNLIFKKHTGITPTGYKRRHTIPEIK